jgi:hypothetical protein
MNPSRSPSSGFPEFRFAAFALLIHLVALGAAPACMAQSGFGPDPFRPYNSQYDPFVYPVAPGPMDFGYNRGGVNGIRGANQFEAYLNSLQSANLGTGAGASGAGLRGGIGTPYFQANRAYDREYDRIYQPNKQADAKFESDQSKVKSLYFEYLREKDPKKRVELFREYSRARRRAQIDLAAPRATATRAGTRAPRRSVTAADGEDGVGLRGRNGSSPPPALPSRSTRTRSGRTESATSPDLGGAPSPFGDSTSRSGSSREVVPSDVLDRAKRTDRTRPGSRVRAPSPGPSMPAPDPLKP